MTDFQRIEQILSKDSRGEFCKSGWNMSGVSSFGKKEMRMGF